MADYLNTLQNVTKDRRLPLVIAGLFYLFTLLIIAHTVTIWQSQPTANNLATHSTIRPKPLINLPTLHLFGIYDSSLDNIPQTRLQLTLQGTVVNVTNPKLSRAIIAAPSAPAKVYRVGDALPGGATVREILKTEIIINNNGNLESLKLPIPTLYPTQSE